MGSNTVMFHMWTLVSWSLLLIWKWRFTYRHFRWLLRDLLAMIESILELPLKNVNHHFNIHQTVRNDFISRSCFRLQYFRVFVHFPSICMYMYIFIYQRRTNSVNTQILVVDRQLYLWYTCYINVLFITLPKNQKCISVAIGVIVCCYRNSIIMKVLASQMSLRFRVYMPVVWPELCQSDNINKITKISVHW